MSRPAPDPVVVAPAPRRVDGVDAARGFALIGMFVAHVAPAAATLQAAELLAIADERPRLLFALTAGIGLGFISGGTRPITEGRGELRRQIAVRAGILIALGMLIWATLHPLVFIILDVYGVAFLVILPLLFLSHVRPSGSASRRSRSRPRSPRSARARISSTRSGTRR